VCIPVPVTQEQELRGAAELVPLLPGRPAQLDAYHLPLSAKAQLTSLASSEVPPRFRIEGQALALHGPSGTAVASRDLLPFDQASVVGSDSTLGWLLLRVEKPSPTLVLFAGLVGLMPHLMIGERLPEAVTLAHTGRTLWLSARQLLPAHAANPTTDDWQASTSVATDIRNLLQQRSAAP
jgi:hypothetical protein